MKQSPQVMNKGNMIAATERARYYVNDRIESTRKLDVDACKDQRLKRHECRACFYSSRIGGSACTERACMCCGMIQMYGSTATDVLCMDCARKHLLCKHCGGDLEMRVRRKQWPVAEGGEE